MTEEDTYKALKRVPIVQMSSLVDDYRFNLQPYEKSTVAEYMVLHGWTLAEYAIARTKAIKAGLLVPNSID